jgi:hypothetical protein
MTRTILLVLCLGATLATAPASHASVFSRADDTRPLPPERWPGWKSHGWELRLGGAMRRGNVEQVQVNASTALKLQLASRHQFFLAGEGTYATFGGDVKLDKSAGSALYAFALHPNWNLFVYTTHAHNRFLKLDYRMTNSAGVCLHSFWPERFDLILVSLGLTPEHGWPADGSIEKTLRATLRFNLGVDLGERSEIGADLWYAPAVTDPGDFRVFGALYVDVELWGPLGVRFALTDEYDSSPRPGVEKNDLEMVPYLVFRVGE